LVGRNQNTLSEINMEFVAAHGIDVVRRLSGGGTVFCDLGNINFTFITDKTAGDESFEKFALPVIEALKSLGIPAEFTGRNDITIHGLKISGNAQHHTKTRLLHHGTILYSGDLGKLAGALITKPLKFVDKSVKSVASRVTNIASHMENPIDVLAFKTYLEESIMKSHGIKHAYELTEFDLKEIERIMNNRFMTWEWNYGYSPKYAFSNTIKTKSGLIEYHLNVEEGLIKNAAIQGDFFGEWPIEDLSNKLIGVRHNQVDLMNELESIEIDKYISGLTLIEFVKGLAETN
jgi:lipoate---protein ligase